MKTVFFLVALLLLPTIAFAEGRCPPGSYPIGESGCAPIPAGGSSADPAQGPVATGKWETRWGAISEDPASLVTGVSVSMKSKRLAIAAATAECKRLGGKKCQTRLSYFNQCAAIADADAQSLARGAGGSVAAHAETEEEAKRLAMEKCSSAMGGQTCVIAYSACSMSEFKSFR